jgi:basic amino acid/polyamine antiporter, APA family
MGHPTLVRALGRWDLTAAMINGVIGSAVFSLPAALAGLAGGASPLAVLAAGLGVCAIVLCFAEVGSRFDQTGGPYLYTRSAFGAAVGFQVGWIQVWTRILSAGAVLNVLASSVGALVPAADDMAGRALTMFCVVAWFTAVNLIGIRQAATTQNLFTLAKLAPLALLIVLGLIRFDATVLATQAVAAPRWTDAVLLLVFAYGGFESAVVAAGESRQPKRDMAFALLVGMGSVAAIYALVQLAVVGTLPHAAGSSAPVAAALGVLLGPVGLTLGALAAIVSACGWMISFSMMMPRVLMAMAHRGELPGIFGRLHRRHRTPHVAIVLNAAAALAVGLGTSFAGAATLAAITRLITYGLTCAALIALRRRLAEPAAVHVPGGPGIAVAGIGFSLYLLATRDLGQLWALAALMAIGGAVWWRQSHRRGASNGGGTT